MGDQEDLNKLLSGSGKSENMLIDRAVKMLNKKAYSMKTSSGEIYPAAYPVETDEPVFGNSFVHWTTGDGRIFIPAAKTTQRLTPGVYEIDTNPQVGIYFEKIPVRTEGLIRFPDTDSDKVVAEIQKFWEREEIFRQYNLTYKRGILLYGPPGSGKSCTVQLIMEDVVGRGGIVIKMSNPLLFIDGMRVLRQIQDDTPVVVIMEDIDSLLEIYDESEVLNILDGVNEVKKCVFLGTTNYPERLGARIVNRPSRFDKRFRIGWPSEASRKIYFEFLIGGKDKVKELKIDMKKWVKDTDRMSIAHLKELFIAVVILGDKYESAIEILKSMEEVLEDKDFTDKMGFATKSSRYE